MVDVSGAYRELLAREMKGPADCEGAMHRLQSKYGIDYWTGWGIKYRPPKTIAHDTVRKIQSAYFSMLEQSVRRDLLKLEIEIARGNADADAENLVVEAQNLLAKIAERKSA